MMSELLNTGLPGFGVNGIMINAVDRGRVDTVNGALLDRRNGGVADKKNGGRKVAKTVSVLTKGTTQPETTEEM